MTGDLTIQLAAVRSAHRRTWRRRRAMQAASWWLAALGLAVIADASWSAIGAATRDDPLAIVQMPAALRTAVSGVLLAGLVASARRVRLPRAARDLPAWRYARLCERQLGLSGNPLTNAVQLADADASLSGALAQRVRQNGDALATRIAPAQVIDTGPMRRQRRVLTALLLGWIGLIGGSLLLPGPNAVGVALGRLAMPWADRPPYAMVALEMAISPDPVAVGDQVRVTMRPRGRHVDRAQITIADGRVLPMSRQGEQYSATLPDVREPLRMSIVAGGTRTRWREVRPLNLPRIEGVQASVHDDGRAAALRWPPRGPVRALAGARLALRVVSNRADARIDDPRAAGLRISMPIERGRQTLDFGLLTPEGLGSRDRLKLELVGLTEARMRELAEAGGPTAESRAIAAPLAAAEAVAAADAADAGQGAMADLTGGQPVEGQIADRDRRQGGERPGSGQAGTAGRGEGHAHAADDADTIEPNEAVGVMLERLGVPPEQRAAVRSFADAAPPPYRSLTARYFLRLAEQTP